MNSAVAAATSTDLPALERDAADLLVQKLNPNTLAIWSRPKPCAVCEARRSTICVSASSALAAVITVLALHRRLLPPNAQCANPDLALKLNLVPQAGLEAHQLQAAISSSFAFGGTNSTLLSARAWTGQQR